MSGVLKMATCVPRMAGFGGCFCGRRGLPAAAIETMYADYLRLGSLAKVGKLHGRTRQNMWDIFARRELKLNARPFKTQIEYKGRKYNEDGHGYFRDTIFRSKKHRPETLLHRRVWTEHRGPIPAGHDVVFKDGNRANWDISNLELLTHEQQQARARTGENGATKSAKARLALLLNGSGRQLAKFQKAA
ncbi:MAG: HNH endonuclease [Hyphomicrobiaceae bacterium]|nr:MAG: HNH endonuclease [Hyphomicrobiaceae bacterium]